MRLVVDILEDMFDMSALCDEVVADQTAVASPVNTFRAHDGGPLRAGGLPQPCECVLEVRSHHVIGIVAKAFVAPAFVRGGGLRLLLRPSAAEPLKPAIGNTCCGARRCQVFLTEMRKGTRAWEAAHISQQRDLMLREQIDEMIQGMIGVADGPDFQMWGINHFVPIMVSGMNKGVRYLFSIFLFAYGYGSASLNIADHLRYAIPALNHCQRVVT